MQKRYNPKVVEEKIQKFWEKSKIFRFNLKSKKPIYSIDTPPPTVSGLLHIGHVMHYSQFEFVARQKRMMGFNVFFPFGFDNNGLATEILTERTKGIKSEDMTRKQFIKAVNEVTKKGEEDYEKLWKRIGVSCDWSSLYRTIEPRIQRMSQLSFLELYQMGRIYRKEAPTIWCPKCSTAIAQVELEDKELSSSFDDIIFKLEDGMQITIATTRPELLAACVAIFVHPDDKRYKTIIGKKAIVPIFKQKVPILKEKAVDPQKGTGIVMCCTFGDLADIDWFRAHKLPVKKAINEKGIMTKESGRYQGLSIKEAREQIKRDLKNFGLLTKEKKIKHTVNVHERCGTEIEFLVSKQWFIKYLDLKKKFLELGNKINWYPNFMKIRYENWINGLQWDWSISRQRHYGIPFPLWYCKKCGKVILADEKQLPVDPLKDKPKKKCKCGSKDFMPEKDVLDTWATSSLTPLINAHWKEKNNLMKKLFPMNLRPQAHDIITFWAFNTIVKSYFHTKERPFKDIMISGHGLDPHGKKMSKSKGNFVDPWDVLNKYPADAVRFWAASARLGHDLPYQEKDIITGQKLLTKLWNATRLVEKTLKKYKGRKPKKLRTIDKWILSKLMRIVKKASNDFDIFEYSTAKIETEIFFWRDFCDNYLEMVKHRIYKGKDLSAQYTLYTTLLTVLKLFTPIIPHVTEEIYQNIFRRREKDISICVSKWPKVDKKLIDKKAEGIGELAKGIISEIRQTKSSRGDSLNTEYKLVTLLQEQYEKLNKDVIDDIKGTMKIKKIKIGKEYEIVK